MTDIYTFICTETTNERAIPDQGQTQLEFNRRVSLAFRDITSGTYQVGDLKFRPTQASIPKHILADGTVYSRETFPQLFAYLGNTFGGDGVTTFAVPDYSNQPIETPAITVTQEVSAGGTVTTGDPVTTPTQPGQVGGTQGGNVPSGGRPPRNLSENENEV